ncbi:MAG: hypothetical protein OXH00_25910 [Candidatus Poribacteria bacterium]|nr:hypothetical protein [Candidatus Poribacteria bacterium]
MAPKRRIGGDSYIFIGRNLKYGVPIIGENVFDGEAPTTSLAKLIRNHFVFTRNTLDPTAEETESESIIGGGATAESIISKRGGGGEWEFELLPDDAIHLLLGWFNPTTLPTNTDLKPQEIPAGKIGAPSSNTVTIDNDDETALAKWPGQLEITLTGSPSGAGKIRAYGQKRGSRSNQFNSPTTEEIAFGDGEKKQTTTNFYHRADRFILDWGNGTAPTGVTLKFLPDTKWAALTLNENNNPFDGWTSQMLKAFTPYIAYNIIPNLFRLSIGANIRLLLGLLASYVQEARSLADPTIVANTLANLRADDGILKKYPRRPLNFYPSLGTAVVLGEPDESLEDLIARIDGDDAPEPIAVTSVDIEGNHNYVDPEGFTGDPLAGQPVTSETESRTVTVNAGIYHETDDATENNETIHWQDIYFEKRKVPIVIRNYNWLSDGRQVLVESRFANCGLTEVPGLPIEGRGSVTRNLAFEANRSVGATTPDEISMRFYSEKGFAE